MDERDAETLELDALQLVTESGMERMKSLLDQIKAAADPKVTAKLSEEYLRLHTSVLKSIEAAHRIEMRQRRRAAARPPVPRQIDGRRVH